MICRLCLLESNEIFKIFEDDGVKLNIAEIVSKHFWFEPKIDDPISNIICNSCWWKIDSFHIFYLSVEQANKNFAENVAIKNEMKNSNFDNNDDQIMIKTEEKDNNESLKDDDDIDNDDDDDEDEDDGGNDDNKSNNDDVSENESGGANDSSSDSDYVNSTSSKRRRKSKENIIKLEPEIKLDIDEPPSSQLQQQISRRLTRSSHNLAIQKLLEEQIQIEKNEQQKRRRIYEKSQEIKRKRSKYTKKSLAEIIPDHSDNDDEEEEDEEENPDSSGKVKKIKTESEYVRKSKEDDEEIANFMKLKCDYCLAEFITFAEVRRHYRTSHNIKGYVICCNKKLYKRILILDHIRKHLNPEYFKCYECNKTFADKQCLKNHMLRHESEDNKIYKCDQCPKSYSKQYTLNCHKRIHIPPDERNFYCEICDKSFSTNNSLQNHRRYVHENVYGQMCHICAKVIRGKTLFEKHQLEHAGIVEPKIQCRECGSWLKNVYSLKKHLKRHAESADQNICNICGKVAPTKGALRSHINYVHSIERQYKCGVCSKAFKKPVTLKEHMTTHTGEVLYSCPHCPKTFNSNANMHSHRKKAHRQEWEEGRRQRFGNSSNFQTLQNYTTISEQDTTTTILCEPKLEII